MPNTIAMDYLINGNYTEALGYVMTDYIGFGILYMLFGMILFGLVFYKTNSYSISGVVFIVYGATVSSTLPPEIGLYFYLLLGVMSAALLIKIIFGK